MALASEDVMGMPTRLCDRCGLRPAVVYQAHTGRALCRECFIEDVTERVHEEVKRWNMIEPGDVILMALSGGKDGYTLLDVLSRIHRTDKLIGLNIVEGIHGYNKEEDAKYLVSTARELGIDVIVTSVKDYTGLSIDEMALMARRAGTGISVCTYCGISRRRIMNSYARELGANKLATAHNLDDEAQTAVINLMRGDLVSLLREHPKGELVKDPRLVRRIKPLRKIYEHETATYAYLRGFHLQDTECPYIYELPTLRARVRRALYALESERPGTLIRMLSELDDLFERLVDEQTPITNLSSCERCGEPVPPGKRLCKLCELLEGIGVKNPRYTLRVVRRPGP